MHNDHNPSKDDRHYGRNIHGSHGRYEVLSVPHVFRAESVGTAWILIGIRAEILEHSTTQIVGNLSNLSDQIPIRKVNSDRTTQNYFRPVSDRKDSQKSDK